MFVSISMHIFPLSWQRNTYITKFLFVRIRGVDLIFVKSKLQTIVSSFDLGCQETYFDSEVVSIIMSPQHVNEYALIYEMTINDLARLILIRLIVVRCCPRWSHACWLEGVDQCRAAGSEIGFNGQDDVLQLLIDRKLVRIFSGYENSWSWTVCGSENWKYIMMMMERTKVSTPRGGHAPLCIQQAACNQRQTSWNVVISDKNDSFPARA